MPSAQSEEESGSLSHRHIRQFQRFSIFSVICTYVIIFAGGLVRVSGAGLGCPDWPRCFGRWYPPTSVDQLPPDIDPSKFNFTLAWIEYINRLGGVLLGFVLIWLAFLAVRHFRSRKDILFPSLASLLLVAFQGWLGSVVVTTELEPVIVTLHMLLALLLVSILIFVSHRSYHLQDTASTKPSSAQRMLSRAIVGLWIVGIVQILIGTQMREQLERIIDRFPLLSGVEQLAQVGGIKHIHVFLGLIVVCATCGVMVYILQKQIGTRLLKQMTFIAVCFVLIQLGLGLGFMTVGMTSFLQLFHLWVASVYLGAIQLMYGEAKRVSTV